MKHIRKITGLLLSAAAALSMTVPAFASDYSFTTDAPQDYYGSTSYEDVYGSQYNYGGKNVVDYQVPELEYGVQSTTMTGVMERTILPGLQQTVGTGGGGYGVAGGGGAAGPSVTLLSEAGPRGTRRGISLSGAPSRPKPFSLMYSSMISAGQAQGTREAARLRRDGARLLPAFSHVLSLPFYFFLFILFLLVVVLFLES